jgi:hypothetical protein
MGAPVLINGTRYKPSPGRSSTASTESAASDRQPKPLEHHLCRTLLKLGEADRIARVLARRRSSTWRRSKIDAAHVRPSKTLRHVLPSACITWA